MSNTQENDKFLTKERKIYLETWIIIAIYLAIALPIHFYVPAFSWHWFTFGLIFLIIPLGLICSKTFFVNKMNLTAEQQKKFNQALGIGMLKLWLADFVYMTAFNHWLIPTYILGIIVLIIVFNSLVNAFLGKRDNNSFLNFCLAADLIIGIALTIYLIYIIPENTGNLQNIITTIVAAIYGGLLTLVGVAWTIKKSDEDRRIDEIKKFRPVFNLMNDKEYESVLIPFNELVSNDQFSFEKIEGELYYIKVFAIRNTSFSEFYLCGLRINKNEVRFDDEYYITRDKTYSIDFQYKPFYFTAKINEIDLEVEDLLGNKYYAKLSFEIKPITAEILEDMSTRKFANHTIRTSTGLKRTEKISCITINKVGKAIMEENNGPVRKTV